MTTQVPPADGSIRFRKLRIAVSVFFGVLTVALCGLWVRSYWVFDGFDHHTGNTLEAFGSNRGKFIALRMPDSDTAHPWDFRSQAVTKSPPSCFIWEGGNYVVVAPIWVSAVLASMGAYAPWLSLRRFSLRTMLIATTLVAVIMGLRLWIIDSDFLIGSPGWWRAHDRAAKVVDGNLNGHGRSMPDKSPR